MNTSPIPARALGASSLACFLALAVALDVSAAPAGAADPSPPMAPLVRTVDLALGESQEIELHGGSKAGVKLTGLHETRDSLRQAVREARVTVEVNGVSLTLTSANYHLPMTIAGVQIDCPVTRGYTVNSSQGNVWALEKDARLRLWPAGSPWMRPGAFNYPLRQRWFASDTQMANEPSFVNGDEVPGQTNVYYHYGLDFGGAEGLVDILAATDGLVVSAADQTLPEHRESPVKPRYDVIYIVDGLGWYYRYSHLMTIDVKAGQRVRMGQRLGALGKEGGSGGWSHLHFDITSRQPSGHWGIQDAYAYVWEAWRQEHHPPLMAVARPHRLARVGESVRLDGAKSWSATQSIAAYDWTFTDGTKASGATVERTYGKPGTYSEVLKVTDQAGREAWDFAVVQVMDPQTNPAGLLPPTIHAANMPTMLVRAAETLLFKVRSFRTTHGEETWDFGDGTPSVKVKSDGNSNAHAKDGYAMTSHRYAKGGNYIARVERANERGETAVGHVWIEAAERAARRTRVSIQGGRWHLNNQVTYPGTKAEGLLMNVRMVNAVFEDRHKPDFDPQANTDRFLARIPDYAAHGVRAFTLGLQGGMPGYEGALNSAFGPDGLLRDSYMARVRGVLEACDRAGVVVILGCFYQRQDQVLADADAVRAGVVQVARWIYHNSFKNVVLEIANEYNHGGFDHAILKSAEGEAELIRLARASAPGLLVSSSGLGDGRLADLVAEAADFLLIHFNGTASQDIPGRIQALKKFGKPIVCNEDDKQGREAARAAELSVANGASWGLMLSSLNQYFPLTYNGAADDPVVYRKLKELTTP